MHSNKIIKCKSVLLLLIAITMSSCKLVKDSKTADIRIIKAQDRLLDNSKCKPNHIIPSTKPRTKEVTVQDFANGKGTWLLKLIEYNNMSQAIDKNKNVIFGSINGELYLDQKLDLERKDVKWTTHCQSFAPGVDIDYQIGAAVQVNAENGDILKRVDISARTGIQLYKTEHDNMLEPDEAENVPAQNINYKISYYRIDENNIEIIMSTTAKEGDSEIRLISKFYYVLEENQ